MATNRDGRFRCERQFQRQHSDRSQPTEPVFPDPGTVGIKPLTARTIGVLMAWTFGERRDGGRSLPPHPNPLPWGEGERGRTEVRRFAAVEKAISLEPCDSQN